MKELSIFIDESGDFGRYSSHSPFYIVSMVFHEQKDSIKHQVDKLNQALIDENLINHTIHTAPLIRRESVYKEMDISLRKRIFNKLFMFSKNVKIKCANLVVDKSQCSNSFDIVNKLSKQLVFLLKENMEYFCSFDNIIVYYDNGQYQLSLALNAVFSSIIIDNFEFRVVLPNQYKLFQTADLFCTLSLLQNKISCKKCLTHSEEIFFGSIGKLRKSYLKYMDKIRLV